MAAGRFEEAIPIYRDLVKALPEHPGPHMDLGLALHMAGHDREAVVEFQKVLKLDPRHLPAWLFLGAAYIGRKEPANAIEPLRRVTRAEPKNAEARRMLGDALLDVERYQEAAAQFERATQLDPENPKEWNGLGLAREGLAGRSFEELEKIAAGSAYWLFLVAESSATADQIGTAFMFYRQAAAKTPGLRGVHAALADLYRKAGHDDWAAVEQSREAALPPLDCTSPTARRDSPPTAECAFAAQRYSEILKRTEVGRTPESLFWRTRAYNELARQAFAHLAQLAPSAEVHELLAKIAFNRKNYAGAAKEWQQALDFSPGNPAYRQGLAVAMSAGGDYEGARRILEDLIKLSPDSADLNYWLGFSLLGMEKPAEAIPFLEKAAQLDPNVLPSQRDLARAYLRVGEVEKAIPHVKAALPLDDDGSLYYQLAQAYRKTGQNELAADALKKFQELQRSAAAQKKAVGKEAEISPP